MSFHPGGTRRTDVSKMEEVPLPVLTENQSFRPASIVTIDDTGLSLQLWDEDKPLRVDWDKVSDKLLGQAMTEGYAVAVKVERRSLSRLVAVSVVDWVTGRASMNQQKL